MSYLLFQISFVVLFCGNVGLCCFFCDPEKQCPPDCPQDYFSLPGILHTLNIVARYFEAGHTPITSQHETVSFFAWSIAWGYLSFRWRYTVKNFGTFVSVLTVLLMFVAAAGLP